MTAAAVQSPMLAAALSYARKGMGVFPIWWAVGPRCACPKGAECGSPGKHPIGDVVPQGVKNASVRDADITTWWTRFPNANIGIRTGHGLVVIDIDPQHDGESSIAKLEDTYGRLPATVESITGGGGRHILFHSTVSVGNSASRLGRGIDIRGDGGYIVAPPSLHVSGRRYEWEASSHPEETAFADLPSWVLALCQSKAASPRAPSTPVPDAVIHGSRNDTLFRLACSLRAKSLSRDAILPALLATNVERCVPPLDEAEVRGIADSACKYEPGQVPREHVAPTDAPPVIGAPTGPDDWQHSLRHDSQGRLTKDPGNAVLVLTNSDPWRGVLSYDAFSDRVLWTRAPDAVSGMATPAAGEFQEHDASYVGHWLAKRAGVTFPRTAVLDAVESAARANTRHPLREYLDSLQWDGKKRLLGWLSTYLGANPTEYSLVVGKLWMVSAVARAYRPGAQVDHMIILEGSQGAGKSSAVRILAGDWYLGSLPDLRDATRASDAIHGSWLVEIGELDALRGASATRVKDFISQTADVYRPAYRRLKVRHPRSCVFIGTTNEGAYLADPTGARRFWPVTVTSLDRAALERDRDQLWAEAREAFRAGEHWWPEADFAPTLRAEQEERYEVDPWDDTVAAWLAGRVTQVFVEDILREVLQVSREHWDVPTLRRVAGILRRHGWHRQRVRTAHGRRYSFCPPSGMGDT